jgi:glycerol-3-phosphate acyltransferase PlsY
MTSDLIASVLLIAGAYLLGALPSAYLLARLVKGIDIRRYGSGNVGISNFSIHVGKKWAVPIVLFDIFVKGMLPVVLASDKALGLGIGVEAGAGIASILGHNWSVFLKFTGGRGMATVLGVVAPLHYPLVVLYGGQAGMAWLGARSRRNALYFIAGVAMIAVFALVLREWGGQPLWAVIPAGSFLLGLLIFYTVITNIPKLQARANDSALWWGLAALMLPVWSAVLQQSWQVTAFSCVFLSVTAFKRLRSNRGTGTGPAERVPLLRLAWNRLVFDRDIDQRGTWIHRSPDRRGQARGSRTDASPDPAPRTPGRGGEPPAAGAGSIGVAR